MTPSATRPVAEEGLTDTPSIDDHTISARARHVDAPAYVPGKGRNLAPPHRGDRKFLPFDEYVASLPRKRMSAGVLLHDDTDRVVLVEPSYKAQWEIPGGTVEAGEAPWHAASRELAEELGIVRGPMRLLVIDHEHTRGDGMPEGVAWMFDGGQVREEDITAIKLDGTEIVSAGLYRPDEVRRRTTSLLARRLVIALAAARHGTGPVLCDDGVPTSRSPDGDAATRGSWRGAP